MLNKCDKPKSPEGPPPPIKTEYILRKSKSYDGPELKKYFHFNKSKSYNSLLYTIEDLSEKLEKLETQKD